MRPPRRPALLALTATLALGLALAVVLGRPAGHPTRGPSPSPSSTTAEAPSSTGFDGALLPTPLAPRDFTLTDQYRRRVELRDYRGRVVVLAFLSTAAAGVSTLIAQQIRGALDDLGHPAPALALSADPRADTPARVRRFLRSVSLSGRMGYLTGTLPQLRHVWRAYRVVPVLAGRAAFARSAAVVLIDPRGRERVVFGVEQLTPKGLAHDIEKLRAG